MKVIKKQTILEAEKNQYGDYTLTDAQGRKSFCTAKAFEAAFDEVPLTIKSAEAVNTKEEEKPVIDNPPLFIFDVIPHEKQRYPTVGDWGWVMGALVGHISDMGNKDYEFMVAIHEAVEAWICRKLGITAQMVDDWDMGPGKDLEDPGSHPDCPYHGPHMLALEIEHKICDALGLNWDEYEAKLAETCPTDKPSDHGDAT